MLDTIIGFFFGLFATILGIFHIAVPVPAPAPYAPPVPVYNSDYSATISDTVPVPVKNTQEKPNQTAPVSSQN